MKLEKLEIVLAFSSFFLFLKAGMFLFNQSDNTFKHLVRAVPSSD